MKKLVGILVLTAAGSSVAAQQQTAGSTASPTRAAAVAYWTTEYAGPERVDASCLAPQLPLPPHNSVVEHKVIKAIRTWQECRRGLMGALAPEATGKTIPAGLYASMTPAEREAALRHVAAVHAKLADALQADADRAIAAQQAWQKEARRYLDGAAERMDAARDRYAAQSPDVVRQNEVARRP